MNRYKLLVRIPGGHSYWRSPGGDVFVADDSMRVNGDPTTTDDGGLRVRSPITVVTAAATGLDSARCYISVPVRVDRHGRRSIVVEQFALTALLALRNALEPVGVDFDLRELHAATAEVRP